MHKGSGLWKQNVSESPGGKSPFGRHGGRWEDNIKMYVTGHDVGESPGTQSAEVAQP
jgi:hypothetical protein